jgi:hypothetical protein
MSEADQTERDIQRGERALQLLREPLIVEAFQIIEQDLIEKWQTSPARDVQARETLYLSQMLLKRLQAQLELVMHTGQVAKATLAQRIKAALRG